MNDPHLTSADPHTVIHPPPGSHHVHEGAPMHDPPDAWHDHSHDELPQHPHAEVQNSRLVLWVGVALAAVIAVSSLIVYGFYVHYNTQRWNERERTTGLAGTPLATASGSPALVRRAEMGKDLSIIARGGSFEMDTETEGVKKTVTVAPIEGAIERVVQNYAK